MKKWNLTFPFNLDSISLKKPKKINEAGAGAADAGEEKDIFFAIAMASESLRYY